MFLPCSPLSSWESITTSAINVYRILCITQPIYSLHWLCILCVENNERNQRLRERNTCICKIYFSNSENAVTQEYMQFVESVNIYFWVCEFLCIYIFLLWAQQTSDWTIFFSILRCLIAIWQNELSCSTLNYLFILLQ